MIDDRYHYFQLNQDEQIVYDALYKGLLRFDKNIRARASFGIVKSVNKILCAVVADNPDLFYFDKTFLKYDYSILQIVFHPTYLFSKDEVARIRQEINQKVSAIASKVCAWGGNDNAKREIALYEYFCTTYRYDMIGLNTKDAKRLNQAHTLIGVFIHNTAVCEGFALAFKYVLNWLDIPCIMVVGKSEFDDETNSSAHAWNIVKLNGKYYQVDSTWGVCISNPTHVRYDYLNLTDQEIGKDHFDFDGMPICNSTDLKKSQTSTLEQLFMKAARSFGGTQNTFTNGSQVQRQGNAYTNGQQGANQNYNNQKQRKPYKVPENEIIEAENLIELKNYIKDEIRARKPFAEVRLIVNPQRTTFRANDSFVIVVEKATRKAAQECGIQLSCNITGGIAKGNEDKQGTVEFQYW